MYNKKIISPSSAIRLLRYALQAVSNGQDFKLVSESLCRSVSARLKSHYLPDGYLDELRDLYERKHGKVEKGTAIVKVKSVDKLFRKDALGIFYDVMTHDGHFLMRNGRVVKILK